MTVGVTNDVREDLNATPWRLKVVPCILSDTYSCVFMLDEGWVHPLAEQQEVAAAAARLKYYRSHQFSPEMNQLYIFDEQ